MTNNDLLFNIQKVENHQELLIVGCGKAGIYLGEVLGKLLPSSKIVYCDNDEAKQKENVLSISEVVNRYKKGLYLISSEKYAAEMKCQLQSLGVNENQIIIAYTEEVNEFIYGIFKNEYAEVPLKKLQFEINISEHCNLNCKCCSQFSSICDEEFIDIVELERDLERLAKIFDGECKYIYLIGGEPLLNPQICNCIKLCRKYFPKGELKIFTNGLLIPNQKESFWQECRTNNVGIIMTKYPVNLNFEAIERKCYEEHIDFEYAFGQTSEKYMMNKGLDLEGKNDPRYSFTHCPEANHCIKLKHGKLYTCSVAPMIYKFNRYFSKDLPITERDYIDIYKEDSKEMILKKLARPIPFCKYCNKTTMAPSYPWGKTNGDISEWCI